MPKTKKCTKCGKRKRLEQFNRDTKGKYGRSAQCKVCKKEYRKKNAEKISKYNQKYNQDNNAQILKRKKQYRKDNADKIREYHTKYCRERSQNDIQFRLINNLRKRISKIIGGQKSGSAIKDLGCSAEELKIHLEQQFHTGMAWENYGEWHVDHIKPLSGFDLTDRKQFLQAAHYTNLQPLWAIDNIKKGGCK